MVTTPRNLSESPGLPPLSPPGPPQPIDAHSIEALSMLPPAIQLPLAKGLDYIGAAQAGGDSRYVLMRMRGLFARIVREFYVAEVRKAEGISAPVDFDITTR